MITMSPYELFNLFIQLCAVGLSILTIALSVLFFTMKKK